MIQENMKNLLEKFKEISRKGWIKSIDKGTGSVGLTLERILDKKPDDLYFPDYEGIEIKCTTRFSKFPVSLFSVAFEGPEFPEINRIVDLYGYPDYEYHEKKVLRVDIKCNSIQKCGKYKFSLYLDEHENKLYLDVYNLDNDLIERKSFVYVDTILKHANLKLTEFALIRASKKKEEDEIFFRYYHFFGYMIKDEKTIIELLKNGILFATLESRVGKSGINDGKYKNKNLVFKIGKDDIEKMFTKVCEYNTDYDINRMIIQNKKTSFFIMK